VGFANPELYAIAGSSPSTYAAAFRDITSGNNDVTGNPNGLFPATSYYDMASGLGTPKLPALAVDLCAIVANAPPLPTISGISIHSGTTLGGTQITISGQNLTGATAVNFGGVPAASFNVVSATSITAYSPAHAAGIQGAAVPVDVWVTTPGGISPPNSGDVFTRRSLGIRATAPRASESELTRPGGFRGATEIDPAATTRGAEAP
jgi:hypothetical protein